MLSSYSDGSYLGDPKFDDLMAELDRRATLVFVHPAIPSAARHIGVDIPIFAMEFTFDTTRAAFNLAYTGALERHREAAQKVDPLRKREEELRREQVGGEKR